MLDGVTLSGSDVRQIVAKFLGIPVSAVIPLRYSFVVNGMTAEEIKAKMEKHSDDNTR